MNKVTTIPLLLMLLLTMTIMGCSTKAEKQEQALTKVSIAKSKNFGVVNKDFFISYEDEATLSIFEGLIKKASRRGGIANMAPPHYDVELIYSNGQTKGIHLWLNEKGQRSVMMYVEDTHTTYVIIESITDQLVDVIQVP